MPAVAQSVRCITPHVTALAETNQTWWLGSRMAKCSGAGTKMARDHLACCRPVGRVELRHSAAKGLGLTWQSRSLTLRVDVTSGVEHLKGHVDVVAFRDALG